MMKTINSSKIPSMPAAPAEVIIDGATWTGSQIGTWSQIETGIEGALQKAE
jgi:hypothetical protein